MRIYVMISRVRSAEKSIINNMELNWNPSFQFASLSSDLANRLHK